MVHFQVPAENPIEFLKNQRSNKSKYVTEYINIISETTRILEDESIDTGRFLTVFTINLQSIKKIQHSDIVVGVSGDNSIGPRLITRRVDPNLSHPYLRKDIMSRIGTTLNNVKFTTHTFEAIAWHRKIKDNPRYYWKPDKGGSSHYSSEIISYLKSMSFSDIEESIRNYREYLKK